MTVMTVPPMTPPAMPQNQEQDVPEEVVDIPHQQDPDRPTQTAEEAEPGREPEPVAEVKEEKEEKEPRDEKDEREDKDEKRATAKPKRKSAPRKAVGGSKTLVVLKDGRVQYADADAVVVVDLDEAAAPDTDVHDVLDRLTELRDAAESPAKAGAVRSLTDLIQEKALG
jgi:hypothetical protein